MITHNRPEPLLHFLKLSFHLFSQSLQPLQLHSSFLLVFNLSSSPSLFSPAAPYNANTTCSEGSELLKPLLLFPLCRSGPQRKDGGSEREGRGWMKEMERIDLLERRDGWGVSGCKDADESNFVYIVCYQFSWIDRWMGVPGVLWKLFLIFMGYPSET